MIDKQIWKGVESLLDNYVQIDNGDIVILLYTSDSFESAVWVSAALQLREITVKRVWMAPLRDDEFLNRLTSALPMPDEITNRMIVLSFERDTLSHTRSLAAALLRYQPHKYLVFRTISASSNLFTDALSISPQKLSALNTTILKRCMNSQRLHVTTRGGTDLKITIDSNRYRWISNRGIARSRSVVILPAGEVATFPASISGVLVADFAFNINAITDQDARLKDYPISVWIEDSRVIKYECSNPAIIRFLDQCFQTNCAYNVGELGFGTNIGVVEAISMNSHINERRPGVHLGFGQHNQDPGIVNYDCQIHLDLIARGGLVWVDEDPEPLNLENIIPSSEQHPMNFREEDVFSPEAEDFEVDDCCGILTSDGLQLCTPQK